MIKKPKRKQKIKRVKNLRRKRNLPLKALKKVTARTRKNLKF
jgi:hypothetical protein